MTCANGLEASKPRQRQVDTAKTKRHHHNVEDWEAKKDQLTYLYIDEGKNLTDIIAHMKSQGFTARCDLFNLLKQEVGLVLWVLSLY
jgi:DNA polymerase I-like protein with 3'-5' exonuclease and polymerase domains